MHNGNGFQTALQVHPLFNLMFDACQCCESNAEGLVNG